MLKIRLRRGGATHAPFYRIVAADKRMARDGKFIELLGTYDPRTKVLKLDAERYARWIQHGAQPSGTLATVVRKNAAKAQA